MGVCHFWMVVMLDCGLRFFRGWRAYSNAADAVIWAASWQRCVQLQIVLAFELVTTWFLQALTIQTRVVVNPCFIRCIAKPIWHIKGLPCEEFMVRGPLLYQYKCIFQLCTSGSMYHQGTLQFIEYSIGCLGVHLAMLILPIRVSRAE
eukprot:1905180-Amphidinium_carterae.1